MGYNDVVEFIVQQIEKEFLLDIESEGLSYDSYIFDIGIDSIDFFRLLEIIKEEYAFQIDDNELNESNFKSINSIAKYINNKMNNKK